MSSDAIEEAMRLVQSMCGRLHAWAHRADQWVIGVARVPSRVAGRIGRMLVRTPTLRSAISKALALAVVESDAPLSAWPERHHGRWATASRIAELLGRRVAEVSYHLRELVEEGEVISAQPWPSGTRGYQPAAGRQGEAPLFALPETIVDERQWILDELARWAALHDGLAPRQADWSKGNDPHHEWPRWDRIVELFEGEAAEKGLRYFVTRRCAPHCACSTGRHYSNGEGDVFCDGCFDCLGRCPHGEMGDWVGPSGWRYALQVAGLEPRRASDSAATPAGRNTRG
jgi:hypothetical protein